MGPIKRRYKALPLFASPLEDPLNPHHHHHGHESDLSTAPTVGNDGATIEASQPFSLLNRLPIFRETEEASSIELFYDLFFVANLSSFTGLHKIDDAAGMSIVPPPSHWNPPVLTTRQR